VAITLLRDTQHFVPWCKNPLYTSHGIASNGNKSINLFFLAVKVAEMAAKKSSGKDGQRLLAALNSMAGDGLSLPSEDHLHLEALIDDYFDDDSGSELGSEWGEEEVNSLNILFTVTLNTIEYGA